MMKLLKNLTAATAIMLLLGAPSLAEKPLYTEWLVEKHDMWQAELSTLESRTNSSKVDELRELVAEIETANEASIRAEGHHHNSPSPKLLLNVMYVEKELQEAFAANPVKTDTVTLR